MRTTLKQALDQTYGCDCGCPHIRIVEAADTEELELAFDHGRKAGYRDGYAAGLNAHDGGFWFGVFLGAAVFGWGVVLVWIWRTF